MPDPLKTGTDEDALWTERLALAIQRTRLAAKHDRVVAGAREGAELLTRMQSRHEDAVLTLELSQLFGLVPPTKIAEATATFLETGLAIGLIEMGLEEIELAHHAIHEELELIGLLLLAHDAALDAIEQTPAAPFAKRPAAPREDRIAS